ncbi:MAG: hypothetical protein ACJ8C4_01915 [Gemmataceae bacterium]
MILRCRIDGLLLSAQFLCDGRLEVTDGDESFVLDSAEAAFYQVLVATAADRQRALSRYRLLRSADGLPDRTLSVVS